MRLERHRVLELLSLERTARCEEVILLCQCHISHPYTIVIINQKTQHLKTQPKRPWPVSTLCDDHAF